jgi:hypothetical protein
MVRDAIVMVPARQTAALSLLAVESCCFLPPRPLMTQAFANTTPRLDPRKFQDPLVTARGRTAGARCAQSAGDAMVQHRNPVQPDMPELLYRILAEE